MLTEAAAAQMLDFSQPLDIKLLDQVVETMYKSSGDEQKLAERVLTALMEHPEAWKRVNSILELSSSQETKYLALHILEVLIRTRWKVLERPQCEAIKNYIFSLIIQTSTNPDQMENGRIYLNKLNVVLVEILKFEWPVNWPDFIRKIVEASKTNEALCQNNMVILRMLSEEVFDFSLGRMTQAKVEHLRHSIYQELELIFQLCQLVLENSQNASLIVATLEALLRFIHWIPLSYIFQTDLIQRLVCRFLGVAAFQNLSLKCLAEIAGLPASEYDDKVVELFSLTISKLKEMLPLSTRISEAYDNGTVDEQYFIQNVAIFFCTFLRTHNNLIEVGKITNQVADAFKYLLQVSEVNDKEILRICFEYWNLWVGELYTQASSVCPPPDAPKLLRKEYAPILSQLRSILISQMVQPEELFVVETEHGEVVREFMEDTYSLSLYRTMRETLIYLTHLDLEETVNTMLEKFRCLVTGGELSVAGITSLCWAVGSISGSMPEKYEMPLILIVYWELYVLCTRTRGTHNYATVVNCMLHIIGQYPRFLRSHCFHLKSAIELLLELMRNTDDGVQDMACDTFAKVAQRCPQELLIPQYENPHSFVENIIGNIDIIISDFQPRQVNAFYGAVATIISEETDEAVQNELIDGLFELPNDSWEEVMRRINVDVNNITDLTVLKHMCYFLETNLATCKPLGHAYLVQFRYIYSDLLSVYALLSDHIKASIATHGDGAVKQPSIRWMRAVKKGIHNLVSCWIHRCNDPALLAEEFLAPLLELAATDYEQSPPVARESEVLLTMTEIVNKLGENVLRTHPRILDAVFHCALEMINMGLEEFPELLANFFLLLQAVNTHCFSVLLTLTADKFKIIIDCVIWAVKHTTREISENGLIFLRTMLINMAITNSPNKQFFFHKFYVEIMQDMFVVITDRFRTCSLTLQASVLACMFRMVEEGVVTVALGGDDPHLSVPAETNVQYIHQRLLELLKQTFPHLHEPQLIIFIRGLFVLDTNVMAFREHLRDFLVQIREISGEDLSDLYLEEREAEIAAAQAEKLRRQAEVAGMLGPSEESPTIFADDGEELDD